MVGPRNAAFAEESAEVEVLLASLTKTKDLTKRIASSLTRLDSSGKIVREAIGPIYSNTQQLQITSRNIDRVNEAIERLRQPLDTRGQEETIIRAGPKPGSFPQYLSALKRVDKALGDLTSTNLRVNESRINDFHSLLTLGVNQLHDLYRSTLQQDAQTIEPLHYITKSLPFPTIPQDRIQLLGQIAAAIASASAQSAKLGQRDEDLAVKMYAEVRGDYLNKSLQNLATASVSTVKVKKDDNKIYKQGDSGISAYAQGLEGMILAEHENTSRIFRSGNDSPRVLTQTCATTIATFSRTMTDLNRHTKSRLLTDCFLTYEILELITPLSYRIESTTNALRPQISDALRPIATPHRASLAEVITQTRSTAESTPSLPPDGSPVAFVNATAQRIQSFCTFDRPVLTLLSSLGDGGWRSTSNLSADNNPATKSSLSLELTPSTENPTLLSHYLLDLIQNLLDPLVARSTALHRNNKPLAGIFQQNCIALLSRAINTHPDAARYLAITPHSTKLESYRKAASSLYLAAWREPSQHLMDTISTKTNSRNSGALDSTSIIKSLSSKDKDKIKDQFKAFNASFEELVARHKSMYMEKEVKGAMAREVSAVIEPLYARFWDRYHEVDKGKGKSVRYGKGDVSAVLAGL
ncbi:Exocyst complex protein exo70 [Cyphellophora attinorum]|uniref:Exocyst complex protein EXO70 n=1 Tax=Cyphellophora attinorum TaxID=1664694 RepID=A0A0N1HEU1_9EURO|nr:Exocyst complex protein exo70 [Phialophora attinorum]KPI43624.1 Exocyst complex protein exo70 [Phialophora attinorum]